MNQAFGAGFDREHKGRPVRVHRWDCRGAFAGIRYWIPCIYEFREGIVFDFFTQVMPMQALSFYQKYKNAPESLAGLAEWDNPYEALSVRIQSANGALPEGWESSCVYKWPAGIPFAGEDSDLPEKEYGRRLSFACYRAERFTLPLTEPFSSLKLTVKARDQWICADQKAFLQENTSTQMQVACPTDGQVYTLTFSGIRREELPFTGISEAAFAEYSCTPPLPEHIHLLFDQSLSPAGGEPVFTGDAGQDVPGAQSVGIIGGADGPTAVFLSSREAKSFCTARRCGDGYEVCLQGIQIRSEEKTILSFVKIIHKKSEKLKIFIKNLLTSHL